MAETETYAIFNDIHFPFHDKSRYDISLKILEKVKKERGLNHLFLNGDILEFQGVSSWPAHPSEKTDFCTELSYGNKKFDELMGLFPDMPVTYICGNHEYRFFRYIRDLAPAMWGILDCPLLLKFPERPLWKFVDYGPIQLVRCGKSNLYLRHEPLGMGVSCAKLTAEKSCIDILFGHTHLHQSYMHKKFGPKPFINKAYSGGWLGDPSRHVFDYRGSKDSWIRGMTIVECDPKSGEYQLEFINLEQIPVFYRGKRFAAR